MRKTRELIENGYYHVTARANRKEFIFEQDNIKMMFIDIMKDTKKKYGFKVKNFCIMSNHIHIIIKPLKKHDLSRIMQRILSIFAIRFNRFYGYCGHVWYDRFKSTIIKTFSHYKTAYQYINNNPVKAGLVENPEDYKYCGIRFLRNKKYEVIDPPGTV